MQLTSTQTEIIEEMFLDFVSEVQKDVLKDDSVNSYDTVFLYMYRELKRYTESNNLQDNSIEIIQD